MSDEDTAIYEEVDKDFMKRMAEFCIATGMKPADYWEMDYEDHLAMVEVLNEKAEAEKAASRGGRK